MNIPTSSELLEAGVHFGHQVRRGHPKMKPYIYGVKDGVHVIDLTLSEKLLKEASDFVFELGQNNKTLLIVGTKKQARPIVEELAKKSGAYYLTNRWVGGFLTNFDEIQKNIKKLKDLKEAKDKGELKRYTKKEQLLIDRKMAKMNLDFSGVLSMDKLPDAMFIIDIVAEATAVKEAIRLGNNENGKVMTVVAITDSNSDPTMVDFPIPGNDDAIKSIKIITETVANSYLEGRKAAGKASAAKLKKEEKQRLADEKAATPEIVEEVAAVEEEVEKKVLKESERKVE